MTILVAALVVAGLHLRQPVLSDSESLALKVCYVAASWMPRPENYGTNTLPHAYVDDPMELLPELDSAFDKARSHGYEFGVAFGGHQDSWSWSVSGRPVSYPVSGVRSFYVDQTLVIRSADMLGGLGTPDMPILERWSESRRLSRIP